MGIDVTNIRAEDAGDALANAIISLMKRTGMPSGLTEVGYAEQDIDRLVEGTLPQRRVTGLSPRSFSPADLKMLFATAMRYW